MTIGNDLQPLTIVNIFAELLNPYRTSKDDYFYWTSFRLLFQHIVLILDQSKTRIR